MPEILRSHKNIILTAFQYHPRDSHQQKERKPPGKKFYETIVCITLARDDDLFRWIPRMLTDMRHYPREEDSKENSLTHVTFEMLGGYKWLKFRGNIWDGDQILKFFL